HLCIIFHSVALREHIIFYCSTVSHNVNNNTLFIYAHFINRVFHIDYICIMWEMNMYFFIYTIVIFISYYNFIKNIFYLPLVLFSTIVNCSSYVVLLVFY